MIDDLKKSSLFSEFDQEELESLADIVKKSSVMHGEYAFREGADGDSLILIRMGTLRITKKNKDGDEQELAILGSGAYLGEMAMFDKGVRSASGLAMENSEILKIPYEDFRNLLDTNKDMAAKFYVKLAMALARRLKYMNEDFAALKKFLKDSH